VGLACGLHYRMGLDHASLLLILSWIDQLHDARQYLRSLTARLQFVLSRSIPAVVRFGICS
jgi:hypothetical protein